MPGNVQIPDAVAVPGIVFLKGDLLQTDVLLILEGFCAKNHDIIRMKYHISTGNKNLVPPLDGGHDDPFRQTDLGDAVVYPGIPFCQMDLDEMDIIHPLINKYGHGIIDGTRDDMVNAIAYAARKGKGLYGMKALAGGKLAHKAKECCRWAYEIPGLSSFAVGMKSRCEVRINVAWALGEEPDSQDLSEYIVERRHIEVTDRCIACGQCLRRCGQRAISLKENDARAFIDESKCVLCGYCRDNCDQDAISII